MYQRGTILQVTQERLDWLLVRLLQAVVHPLSEYDRLLLRTFIGNLLRHGGGGGGLDVRARGEPSNEEREALTNRRESNLAALRTKPTSQSNRPRSMRYAACRWRGRRYSSALVPCESTQGADGSW